MLLANHKHKHQPPHPWLLANPTPCIMGCTSSAPNMTTHSNATENKLESNDEKLSEPVKKDAATMYADEENEINEIKVLPTCDTLAEPIQLDSNNKSTIVPNSDLDKGTHEEHVQIESSPKNVDNILVEEKLSSLGEVVEKVVELFVADNSVNGVEDISVRKEATSLSKENNKENAVDSSTAQTELPDTGPNEQEVEGVEGATSPTQSTSSRATRWEALADIAAELPPSLAVDPLTGQIYALSK